MTGQGALAYVILTLWRLSREDHKVEAIPDYTAKLCFINKTTNHCAVISGKLLVDHSYDFLF